MNVSTFAMAHLLRVLPRERITRAVGRLCDMPLSPRVSRAVVGAYVRAYDVDLDEAAPVNGRGAYDSFDAFFTRALREGTRTMPEDPSALASPADGRLDAVGDVEDDRIVVKGRPYTASELLISQDEAKRYRGGRFAVIYLSPRDYHRVHSPAAGRIVELRSAPGELFPVNRISERHIPDFLTRNRRVAITLDTEAFGRLTVVMVAAMIVGRITVTGVDARDVPYGTHSPEPPVSLARGEELGIFHLGSTIVLFVEPPAREAVERPTGPIRWGDAMSPDAQPENADG